MNILQQNKQPILSQIEGHEKQFYEEPAQLSTKQYLNQVHKQVKQIDAKVGQLSKQLDQWAKQDQKQQRKEQLNLFRKPLIKTKEQIQQEKKDKEEKRLNQFIQEMVDKYSPYLLQPEKVEKTQEQLIYQEEYQQYLVDKQQKSSIQKGLKSKEIKPFLFSSRRSNQQSTLQQDVVQTGQNKEEHQKLIQIQQKQVQNERKKRQQMIYFKILDEKMKADTSTFVKTHKSIILRIFTKIDKEHSGYISKQELIDYFDEFQIFIDLFDLDWPKFRNFVLKVKALRKGLLNKQELIIILEDNKLKLPIDEVIAKIKSKQKSDYRIPKENDEDNEQQIENENIEQNKDINQIDPTVDYQQLEEITQINKIYQDTYYPLYHENIQDKKILLDIQQKKEDKKSRKLDPNFISFANEISDLQNKYGQGQLAYQKDESNIIEQQLSNMYIKR